MLTAQLPNPGKYFPLQRVALAFQIIKRRTHEKSEAASLDRHGSLAPSLAEPKKDWKASSVIVRIARCG
jgi:hypothetical protein